MSFIQRTGVLVCLFITLILIILGFQVWIPAVGGEILDQVSKVTEVQDLLMGMSAEEKTSHFLMTLSLDMLFPLIYGGFFIGITSRGFGAVGGRLIIPTIVLIPIDLSENFIQLLALKGYEFLLPIKALLTPLKLMLFDAALVIALVALSYILWGGRHRMIRR